MCKLLGLYPQRQEGLWMQRVVVPGGVLTGDQWRAFAALAREFTPSTPLHLTTRQDVELHDVSPAQVPAIHKRLHEVGLSTLGAGGDSLRNVTVCPCCSCSAPDKPDLMALAGQAAGLLRRQEGIFRLPRKFKISLSACPNKCGKPYLNDLGLVAAKKGGQWGFEVIAAGSLGPKPATGIRCFDWLPVQDVLPLALAAVRLFAAHGDREHRGQARLRHVRQRVGDAKFLEMLRAELELVRKESDWQVAADDKTIHGETAIKVPLANVWGSILAFPNGDLSQEQATQIAALADRADLGVRITTDQSVEVQAVNQETLPQAIASHPGLTEAAQPHATIVACPGRRWCHRGLVDTQAMANRLREIVPADFDRKICVSGCPNGCTHSAVADVGLIGQIQNVEGQRVDAFVMMAGGGSGRDERMAQSCGVWPAQHVPEKLKELGLLR